MKRFLSTAFAITLATGAVAGNSDRYNDLRFDSAKGHVGQTVSTTHPAPSPKVTLSTSGKKMVRYADANPYGVGPDNDSR